MSVVVCTYDFILLVAIFKDNLVYNVEELSSSENIVTLKYDFILIPVLVISCCLLPLYGMLFYLLLYVFACHILYKKFNDTFQVCVYPEHEERQPKERIEDYIAHHSAHYD